MAEPSLAVFRRFIRRDAAGALQAEAVLSRDCFESWLRSRNSPPAEAEKTFQRSLTAHVTGSDGRTPFSPQEEEALLKVLRQKRVWPAFQGQGAAELTIGAKGFRSYGFHEKTNRCARNR